MQPASIGPFQIVRELGRGGMGEVFLARDTRLDRQVAIKALPAHLAQDSDRLARFQREAKVLASLNHPGIAAIYGLEEATGHQYLILEFIEGETLADRLVSGPIPVDEVLAIARQMADALEVAHEKGVVHRDLKPANVMVTPDGAVKVLDFGLARTADGSPSTTSALGNPDSPTMPIQSPTIPGAIMGTAGYMSPEQARGKPVDKRSDIFSFGCVLFEMLTGVGPFPGETTTDSLGAILHREPDWSQLPPATPARVRELLRACLTKDRRNRLHDIGDARLELERTIAGHEWAASAAPTAARKQNRLIPATLVVVAAALAGGAGWLLSAKFNRAAPVPPAQTLHLAATIQNKPAFESLAAISPDAKFLVYTASPELPPDSAKPHGLLMVRRLDRDETTVIEGSEGALAAALSPDGRWVAFACAKDRARSKLSLKKVAIENGRPTGKPETICDLPQVTWPNLCWASDREIVFSPSWESTIYAVSASGGEPRVILREDVPKGIENWADLHPLVAGESILATRWSVEGQKFKVSSEIIELATGARTQVLADAGGAQYIPHLNGTGGCLLAIRGSQVALIAVPFELGTRRTTGEPVTVWSGKPLNGFCISSTGTLALATRSADISDRRLAWIDERGQPQSIPGTTKSFSEIMVSPDGTRVVVALEDNGPGELVSDLWVHDLARRTTIRIPIQGAVIGSNWSPDGQHLVYGLVADGAFSLWERRSDGSGEPVKLFAGPDSRTLIVPQAWLPDGKSLAFLQVDMAADNPDVYLLEQEAAGGTWAAKPYLKSPTTEVFSNISRDGKWVLVESSHSGRAEIYIQRFTGNGESDIAAGRVQVSTGGINGPSWWSQDGKEIRYLNADRQVMSVKVQTDPTVSASEPTILYSIKDLKTRTTTFARDGRMMAVLLGQSEQTTSTIDVVVNFLDEARAKLPANP